MNIKNKKALENLTDKNIDVELGQELTPFKNLNKDENQELQLNPQGSETYYEL